MVCQWAEFQAFCLYLYHMPGQHRAPAFQPHPVLAPYELCSSEFPWKFVGDQPTYGRSILDKLTLRSHISEAFRTNPAIK